MIYYDRERIRERIALERASKNSLKGPYESRYLIPDKIESWYGSIRPLSTSGWRTIGPKELVTWNDL